MDGSYQNKKEQILAFLVQWVDQVISQKLWKKFADLHIDEVDTEFKNPTNWIQGSIFVLGSIMSLIDKSRYDVILAIPLSCMTSESTSNFKQLKELDGELDLTPPSFYLFPKGDENFEKTIKNSKFLKEISKNEGSRIFYSEMNEEDEIYRTIYIKMF